GWPNPALKDGACGEDFGSTERFGWPGEPSAPALEWVFEAPPCGGASNLSRSPLLSLFNPAPHCDVSHASILGDLPSRHPIPEVQVTHKHITPRLQRLQLLNHLVQLSKPGLTPLILDPFTHTRHPHHIRSNPVHAGRPVANILLNPGRDLVDLVVTGVRADPVLAGRVMRLHLSPRGDVDVDQLPVLTARPPRGDDPLDLVSGFCCDRA